MHRRKLYDETGSLEDTEGLSGEAFTSLYDYYRTVYPKVCSKIESQRLPNSR